MDGSPGLLTTRPLIFNREQIHLFVNVVIQPGGFLQVAVLDVETQLPLADFPHNGSSIDGMPPNTAVEVGDETNALIALSAQGIGAAPGSPFMVGPGSTPHLRLTLATVAEGSDDLAEALADAASIPPGRRVGV